MSNDWHTRQPPIKGLLLDISGVLYDSGASGGTPIEGSIEAVSKLKSVGFPVRFCTNETQCTRSMLVTKLQRLGFDVSEDEVFPPAPAACRVIQKRNLRPHLVVHTDVLPDFVGVDSTNPNCVVLGDAPDELSYSNLNKAFQVLMSLENPVLISMGRGKYYKENDSLSLDVGAFMAALEYSCGIKAEVVGKPAKVFFDAPLEDMGLNPENVTMIGDDIVNDVGGAQACGMRGVQVRTGKYRPKDENHPDVKPDGLVDNLLQAVDLILANWQ